MATANQAVSIDQVMDAMAILLEKSTGFTSDRIIEWNWENRPIIDAGRPTVWFRWISEEPDIDSGAGRYGFKTNVTLEINVTTRDMSDTAHRDKRLARAHIATRYLVINGVMGRMLHDNYDDRVGVNPPNPPQGNNVDVNVLSIGTMTMAKLPELSRPRPEQGYVESRIGVTFPVVLKVTTGDVALLIN